MRFTVEPSPSGGYFVRVDGADAPVSRHDTEEEAEAAAASYRHGVEQHREGERAGRASASPATRATPTGPTRPRRRCP